MAVTSFEAGSSVAATGQPVPAKVSWATLSVGTAHTCGIQADGTMWCWGYNSLGQLGDGTHTDSSVPVQVGNETDWVAVTAGTAHSCGIRADHSAWCWGGNFDGQLGNGTTVSSTTPVQVGKLSNWQAITAGSSHTCGLRNDGSAWCWGAGDFGKLGNGRRGRFHRTRPVLVLGGHQYLSINAGTSHTCAVADDNTLWCWGSNFYGQLGDGLHGRQNSSAVPIQEGRKFTDWTGVTAGGGHTCGIRASQTLWCWGSNKYGQLGVRTRGLLVLRPLRVGNDTWSSVSAGLVHTCGTQTDGTAWCWGNNEFGQLGDGTTKDSNTPGQIGSAKNWKGLVAGGAHSCALRGNGKIAYCWGRNVFGQLGDGTTKDRLVPTKVKAG